MKKVVLVLLFAIVTNFAQADSRSLLAHLSKLSTLNHFAFQSLGDYIIEHKDTARVMSDGEGGLIAGYDVFLKSDLNTSDKAEMSLSVLDLDMSGDFTVGDGMLLRGMSQRLGFEYQASGIESLEFNQHGLLREALRQFREEAEVVSGIGELNEVDDRLNQHFTEQRTVIEGAQEILFK